MALTLIPRTELLQELRQKLGRARGDYVRARLDLEATRARAREAERLAAQLDWAQRYCTPAPGGGSWRQEIRRAEEVLGQCEEQLRQTDALLGYAERHLPEEA